MTTTGNFLLFAQETGKDIKKLRSQQNGNVADLSALATTAKANLVEAINETLAIANQAKTASASTVTISDTTVSKTKVFSSSFVVELMDKVGMNLGGAGLNTSVYKTIEALSVALNTVVSTTIPGINTSLAATVNFVDYSKAQTLTQAQKDFACANIEAVSLSLFGDPNVDLLAAYNTAKA
jgi:hypothetical protein